MASFKKVIKGTWLGKRYAVIEGKENAGYAETPSSKRTTSGLSERKTNAMDTRPTLRRNTSVTQSVRDVVGTFRQKLRKSTKQRKRLQDSPCTPGFKKKAQTNKKTPTRRGGYREVKMYSPFSFETPDRSHHTGTRREPFKWFDNETPSKLRKEVEDLTANMQALVALSPRTLQSRSSRRFDNETPSKLRKEVEDLTANMQALVALSPRTLQSRSSRRSLMNSPLTNGSFKTPDRKTRTPRSRRSIPTTTL